MSMNYPRSPKLLILLHLQDGKPITCCYAQLRLVGASFARSLSIRTGVSLEPKLTYPAGCKKLSVSQHALVLEPSPTPQTHGKLLERSQKCPQRHSSESQPDLPTRQPKTQSALVAKEGLLPYNPAPRTSNARRFAPVPVPAMPKFHTTFLNNICLRSDGSSQLC